MDTHDCEVCPCSTPGSTHCPCLHSTVETDAARAAAKRLMDQAFLTAGDAAGRARVLEDWETILDALQMVARGAAMSTVETAQMDRPAYELVRLLQDLLDDADQLADSPEDPNNVRVWAVRAVMEDFGGRPHRWTPPRCGDCNHPFSLHDDECWLCDCALTRSEALNGRDESIDDAIEQVCRPEEQA